MYAASQYGRIECEDEHFRDYVLRVGDQRSGLTNGGQHRGAAGRHVVVRIVVAQPQQAAAANDSAHRENQASRTHPGQRSVFSVLPVRARDGLGRSVACSLHRRAERNRLPARAALVRGDPFGYELVVAPSA